MNVLFNDLKLIREQLKKSIISNEMKDFLFYELYKLQKENLFSEPENLEKLINGKTMKWFKLFLE